MSVDNQTTTIRFNEKFYAPTPRKFAVGNLQGNLWKK